MVSSLRTKLGPLVICLVVVLSNLANWHEPAGQIIAAQRSQLSLQYHAKETWVETGKVVSQQMVIKHELRYFQWQFRRLKIIRRIDKLPDETPLSTKTWIKIRQFIVKLPW
nr:hypothetical protein [Liquorilactobacillus satsumensis]